MDKSSRPRRLLDQIAFWFIAATLIGLAAALIMKFAGVVEHPTWKIALVWHGLLFWPWFFRRVQTLVS